MKSGWWRQQEQNGWGKQASAVASQNLAEDRQDAGCEREGGGSSSSKVLSLSSRDMRRLNWNILEEEEVTWRDIQA